MNIQEARNHIGKEVVLDESTKPYKFLNGGDIPKQIIESFIGTRATIAQINSLGSVEIDFTLSDGSSDYWWFNPHHLKIKEKPMKKYKIRVTPETSAEVQELLFELGCAWASGQVNSQHTTMPYLYIYSKIITHGDDGSHFNKLGNQEITLPELRDMVVLKRNDVDDATHGAHFSYDRFYISDNCIKEYSDGKWVDKVSHAMPIPLSDLEETFFQVVGRGSKEMTWQDAYIAIANGQQVQVWIADGDRWETINHHDNWSIAELAQERIRLEPPSITLEARAYTKEELLKIAEEME